MSPATSFSSDIVSSKSVVLNRNWEKYPNRGESENSGEMLRFVLCIILHFDFNNKLVKKNTVFLPNTTIMTLFLYSINVLYSA